MSKDMYIDNYLHMFTKYKPSYYAILCTSIVFYSKSILVKQEKWVEISFFSANPLVNARIKKFSAKKASKIEHRALIIIMYVFIPSNRSNPNSISFFWYPIRLEYHKNDRN